jgi:threonine dehydratase
MGALAVTRDDVARAASVIEGRVHHTPVFSARSIRDGLFLKAELFQRTGSFKPRGVLTNLASLSAEERTRGVISVSAGNHAQALAWGAREEGIDALLVMWRGASPAKLAATRAYGAAVDLEAAGPTEAFPRLQELAEQTGRVIVHPFDAPATIAGQGTVGREILDGVDGVDVVVVPCGGGGLVSGIAVACEGSGVRVVAVEPEGSTALRDGLAAGKPVPVHPSSIADALSAPFAGERTVALCTALGVDAVTVSDDEIRDAFRTLYARAKLAVEPGAAAGLAAVLAGRIAGDRIAVVVSGGNVSADIASDILAGR